ncbi:MAG: DUF4402 domain-containing protein [Bdellovibrionales bacterium]
MGRQLRYFFKASLGFAIIAICLYGPQKAYSIATTNLVRMYVPGSIGIIKISDLDFGVEVQGGPRKRVPRGSAETPENASFLVQGVGGATFTISIPPGSIFLDHPTSGDQLEVRNFRSRPNGSGRIQNNGERMVYVGATRRPIPLTAAPGLYTGTFTVTVVY